MSESDDEIKVGDEVVSEKWDVRGTVEEIFPCPLCDRPSLAIRTKVGGKPKHHHARSFKKV